MKKAKRLINHINQYPPAKKKANDVKVLSLLILFIVIVGFTIMPN